MANITQTDLTNLSNALTKAFDTKLAQLKIDILKEAKSYVPTYSATNPFPSSSLPDLDSDPTQAAAYEVFIGKIVDKKLATLTTSPTTKPAVVPTTPTVSSANLITDSSFLDTFTVTGKEAKTQLVEVVAGQSYKATVNLLKIGNGGGIYVALVDPDNGRDVLYFKLVKMNVSELTFTPNVSGKLKFTVRANDETATFDKGTSLIKA
jgi:hypothetical protein